MLRWYTDLDVLKLEGASEIFELKLNKLGSWICAVYIYLFLPKLGASVYGESYEGN